MSTNTFENWEEKEQVVRSKCTLHKPTDNNGTNEDIKEDNNNEETKDNI